MRCANCTSEHVFVFPGDDAASSVKRCIVCSFESPLSEADWLEHQQDEAREDALASALAEIRNGHPQAAVKRLAGIVNAAQADLAGRAIRGIGSARCEEAVCVLDDIAGGGNEQLRAAALRHLGGLRMESAAQALLRHHDRLPEVRPLVERALIAGGDAAVDLLAARLPRRGSEDSGPWEQLLTRIATERAKQALVRWRVSLCLARVSRQERTPVEADGELLALGMEAAEALAEALDHEDAMARFTALRGLVQVGASAAVSALERCQADPDPDVSSYARYELSRLRTPPRARTAW
jgi:HEAT repeat protein